MTALDNASAGRALPPSRRLLLPREATRSAVTWRRALAAVGGVILAVLLVVPAAVGFIAGSAVTAALWTWAAVVDGYETGRTR